MKSSEILLSSELEKEIAQKNTLLKCLCVAYTCALDYFDEENYDAFLEKLEAQQNLLEQIDGIDHEIARMAENGGEYKGQGLEILDFAKRYKGQSGLPAVLKNVAEGLAQSERLINNCRALNKKLIYRANELKTETNQKLLALKNKKLAKTGYEKKIVQKAGLIIDYKNN